MLNKTDWRQILYIIAAAVLFGIAVVLWQPVLEKREYERMLSEPTLDAWRIRSELVLETPSGLMRGESISAHSEYYTKSWLAKTFGGNDTRRHSRNEAEALAIEISPDKWLFWSGRDYSPETHVPGLIYRQKRARMKDGEGVDFAWPAEVPGRFFTFRDISDPTSRVNLQKWNLAEHFGEGVKFHSARIEYTSRPVTRHIEDIVKGSSLSALRSTDVVVDREDVRKKHGIKKPSNSFSSSPKSDWECPRDAVNISGRCLITSTETGSVSTPLAQMQSAPEVHIVFLGASEPGLDRNESGRPVDVYVDRVGKDVTLVLAAQRDTEWRIWKSEGTNKIVAYIPGRPGTDHLTPILLDGKPDGAVRLPLQSEHLSVFSTKTRYAKTALEEISGTLGADRVSSVTSFVFAPDGGFQVTAAPGAVVPEADDFATLNIKALPTVFQDVIEHGKYRVYLGNHDFGIYRNSKRRSVPVAQPPHLKVHSSAAMSEDAKNFWMISRADNKTLLRYSVETETWSSAPLEGIRGSDFVIDETTREIIFAPDKENGMALEIAALDGSAIHSKMIDPADFPGAAYDFSVMPLNKRRKPDVMVMAATEGKVLISYCLNNRLSICSEYAFFILDRTTWEVQRVKTTP